MLIIFFSFLLCATAFFSPKSTIKIHAFELKIAPGLNAFVYFSFWNINFIFTSHLGDIEQKIAEDCGTICKPRWNGKWMELQIDKVVLSEENKKKYGAKLDMIRFILNCRNYSQHIYTGCKFYYFFKLDKYKDRILDILREMWVIF